MTTQSTTQALRIQRMLNAPVEKVYHAFVDEAALAQWFGPVGVKFINIEAEPKVGGCRNMQAVHEDSGKTTNIHGEYVEVLPNQRLKFTWNSPDCDPPVFETLVTIEFNAQGDKTEVIILHENLPSDQAIENHRFGWTSSLNKLEFSGLVGPKPLMLGIVPHIVYDNAAEAINYYVKTFGAIEITRLPLEDGRILHAALLLNQGHLFLCDRFCETQGTLDNSAMTLHMDVADVDTVFQKAVENGATVKMPVADMFWGARYGQIQDPFGVSWSLATPTKNVTPEELVAGAKACFAE